MPWSDTATSTTPSSAFTPMPTRDPFGEYTIALAMRLPNASIRICESPRTQTPRSPPRASSTPAESACTTCASRAVASTSSIETGRTSDSASSVWSLDRLMMRPVSCPRRAASAEIRVAKWRTCAGSSAADSMASASRVTAPTGVLSSWLVLATKSRRIWSRRSCSVTSRMISRVMRGLIALARADTSRGSRLSPPRVMRRDSVAELPSLRPPHELTQLGVLERRSHLDAESRGRLGDGEHEPRGIDHAGCVVHAAQNGGDARRNGE